MGRYECAVLVILLLVEIAEICLCANSNVHCIEHERQALLEFKASFDEDSLIRLSSWKGNNCCKWEGIGCDNVTAHVVKLDLRTPCSLEVHTELLHYPSEDNVEYLSPYYNDNVDYLFPYYNDMANCLRLIAPNLNSSLLQLRSLTYLDLSGNYFSYSQIPMFLGSMGRLEYLSLSNAYFIGLIPNSLGNLKNLRLLDLSFNFLDLQMNDDTSWISKLHSLKHLDLSGVFLWEDTNFFSGTQLLPSLLHLYLFDCDLDNSLIPRNAFQNMSSLVSLDLSSNYLTDPILVAFRNLSSIQLLFLYNNGFTSIPSWFNDFEKLTFFDLSYNRLHGQIPYAFTNLSSLVHLDLVGNYLDSISSLLFSNLKKLVHFDIGYNRLYGPIPEAFRNMTTSIEFLGLSYNNFTSVPSWFCKFEKLTHLDLSFNSLHGPIPDVFRNMFSIESLQLQGNNLTSIPSWLAQLKKLVTLDLNRNQLTLTECFLSSIITNMCHLKELDLSRNKLQGELMGQLELSGCIRYDLKFLDLRYNDISDRMPTWLGQLENLKYLDFSSNFLEGVLSSNIGQLVNLIWLDLSSNKFHGSISQSLGKLAKLQYLNLSKNHFNGFIPQSLGKLAKLEYLDLANNSLNGVIPESLGQLVSLKHLDISSNKLNEIMFMKKERATIVPYLNLRELDLSHNQISGSLPKNIGHIMPSLGNLFLGSNLLNGSIPISFCQSMLLILDLSNNNLSGEIPNCWEKNQILYNINLSSNKLEGVFPSSFGSIYSLRWLHLNNNSLQGELPRSLGNLEQLLILDLGENHFFGSIPSSWTANKFPSLQILRLRQNMLSGNIPSQLCRFKSLKILDLSRNRLQGSIPRCIGYLQGMTLDKALYRANQSLVSMQPYKLIAKAPSPISINVRGLAAASPSVSTAPIAVPSTAPESPVEWSSQDVTEVMKGRELKYTKIVKLVVNMDLSENNLVGFIPDEITWLTELHGLNLSKNQLKGEIPKLIGDMKSLESLDMSHNHLSGTIPNTMSALTSLSHLNLSHNNLSGPIPLDNQFLTFDDPSIYAYNSYLCGSPLPNKCPGDISRGTSERKGEEEENEGDVEKVWFYFVIAIGFASGLWGFIGTLWLKKNWRHAYFRWVEDVADDIYVTVVIKMGNIKKHMMRNHVQG